MEIDSLVTIRRLDRCGLCDLSFYVVSRANQETTPAETKGENKAKAGAKSAASKGCCKAGKTKESKESETIQTARTFRVSKGAAVPV
jgi:hypothetical protein